MQILFFSFTFQTFSLFCGDVCKRKKRWLSKIIYPWLFLRLESLRFVSSALWVYLYFLDFFFFFLNSESIWHLGRKNFGKVQSRPLLEKDPVVGPSQDSGKVSWDPHPSALEYCIRDCTFRLKGQRLALSTKHFFLCGLQAPS